MGMIVVIWCCHVRRYMRVSHVMLQNALWWLHECCMGLVLGSRSTKPCVFPCKVAAAGDEGYLLCAAGGLDRFEVNRFLHCVLQRVDANRNVMAAWMCAWCCKTHCNGCMNVAWGWFWGGSRSTKPCVFPCKVAAAGDERYLRPWLPFELGQPWHAGCARLSSRPGPARQLAWNLLGLPLVGLAFFAASARFTLRGFLPQPCRLCSSSVWYAMVLWPVGLSSGCPCFSC